MGCSNIQMTAQKTSGRGVVTTFAPTQGNFNRGELEISDDGFGGADVYDVTVQLTCLGAEHSAPYLPARLSCTHESQTSSCHMGRLEIYNPSAMHAAGRGEGTWGTVCGTTQHDRL